MDLLMPEADGLTGTRLISAELPEVKVTRRVGGSAFNPPGGQRER
jgi:hypothetical protein